jgi:hypothetical protein
LRQTPISGRHRIAHDHEGTSVDQLDGKSGDVLLHVVAPRVWTLFSLAGKDISFGQVLLELQRDWTRHATHDGARSIVEAHGGGYGIGLAYARDMIHPA